MPARSIGEDEREAVLRLDGPARFRHFVKMVVGAEEAWGLWEEGWAMMPDDDGADRLPLWPAREYAELHVDGSWRGYAPRRIPLDELLEGFLGHLNAAGIPVAVFPTADGKAVTPATSELRSALERECEGHF